MPYSPDFLGSFWSGFPATLTNGEMNIVSGKDTIAAAIIDVCLTRKGEIPHRPDYGLSPELFGSFNEVDLDYWSTIAYQDISDNIPGLDLLFVNVDASNEADGRFSVSIEYSTRNSYDRRSAIVFPYSTYLGVDYESSLSEFLAGISIDGQPFKGVRL